MQQLKDKDNTRACESVGEKAAGDGLKTQVRAGHVLWTHAGFLWEGGGQSKKAITETQ